MDNILNSKTKTLTLLLADPHTNLATNKLEELVNDLSNNTIPTLLYEFNSYDYWYKLNSKKETLKKSQVFLEQKSFLEDIDYTTRSYKTLYDIQYLVIDGLHEISTMKKYELGHADIVSIIIKQLKQLAQELNIRVIATVPTSSKITNDDLNSNPSKVLSYFCNPETALEYIDYIYILDIVRQEI